MKPENYLFYHQKMSQSAIIADFDLFDENKN